MTPVVMEKVKGIPKIIRKLDREISTCFQMIWVMSLIYGHPPITSRVARAVLGPTSASSVKGSILRKSRPVITAERPVRAPLRIPVAGGRGPAARQGRPGENHERQQE